MFSKSNLFIFIFCSIFSHLLVFCAYFLMGLSPNDYPHQSTGSLSLSVFMQSSAPPSAKVIDANNPPPVLSNEQKSGMNSQDKNHSQALDSFREPFSDASTSIQPSDTRIEKPQPTNMPENLGPITDPSKFEIDTKALATNDKMPVGPFGSSSPNTRWGNMNSPIGTYPGGEQSINVIQAQEIQKRQRKQVFLDAIKLRHSYILNNTEILACLAFINLDATQGSVTCAPPEATPQEIALLNGAVSMSATKPPNAFCYPFGHHNAKLLCP